MNKERRKKIEAIKSRIQIVKDELEAIKADEEFAFDAMPENLQSSLRGEESEGAIEAMDGAIEQLEEAVSQLDEII